jgi:tetratricopeptide (TPR) repeat protein
VFVGGCTFDAARGVCDADGDGLQSLLDKSLLRKRSTELGPRYWMLETIREYAAERLEEADEDDDLRARHARFFLELGESLGLSVDAFDPGTPQRHDVALADLDNFRAAMDWAYERDPQLGLEVAIALEQHFVAHDPREGRHWYEELLSRVGVLAPELRARALRSLGGIAELGGDLDEAERDYTESFQLYEDMGDEWGIVHLRHRLANCALHRGDLDRAKLMYERNLLRARTIRRGSLEAEALLGLGSVALQAGDFQESYDRYRDATVKCRELRWPWGETNALLRLGELALELGKPTEADEHARAALRPARDMQGRLNCARGLTLLAAVARLQGDAERAGRLWGTVEGDQERRGPLGRPDLFQRLIAHVVTTDDPEFDRGLAAGRNLRLEDVVESVLAIPK